MQVVKAPWTVTLSKEDMEAMARVLNDPEITHWDISQRRSGDFQCWLHHYDKATAYSLGETMREAIQKAYERFKPQMDV